MTVEKSKLAEEFHLQTSHLKQFEPHYNIAPSRLVSALIGTPEPTLELLRWGLIPSWANDPAVGSRMINARRETLLEKPSFRGLFKKQRCLILADGFYEWKKVGAGKIPYYIRLKSRMPFGFAGLWSEWIAPDESEIRSCAIITGEPNELIKPIHTRMPMILRKHEREAWLDPLNSDTEELMNFLNPYPSDEMEAYPVSKAVNSPGNNSPECLQEAKAV